jgi:hypothetical protein
MDQVLTLLADRGPVLASVFLVLSGVFLLSIFKLLGNDADKIPLVGGEIGSAEKRRKAYISNARELYAKGYERFRNSAFRLTDTDGGFILSPSDGCPFRLVLGGTRCVFANICTTGEKIILPRHLADEARRIPDEYVSITKAFEKVKGDHGAIY